MVQLEELLQIRHCVFVMGPPGAGKSQSWKVGDQLVGIANGDLMCLGARRGRMRVSRQYTTFWSFTDVDVCLSNWQRATPD